MKTKTCLLSVFVCLAIVLSSCVTIVGNPSDNTNTREEETARPSRTPATESEQTTAPPQNTANPVNLNAAMNSQVDGPEFSLLLFDAQYGRMVSTGQSNQYAANGNVLLFLLFDVATSIEGSIWFSYRENMELYCDGTKIPPVSSMAVIDGYSRLEMSIHSDYSDSGYGVWEVPENWISVEVHCLGSEGELFASYKVDRRDAYEAGSAETYTPPPATQSPTQAPDSEIDLDYIFEGMTFDTIYNYYTGYSFSLGMLESEIDAQILHLYNESSDGVDFYDDYSIGIEFVDGYANAFYILQSTGWVVKYGVEIGDPMSYVSDTYGSSTYMPESALYSFDSNHQQTYDENHYAYYIAFIFDDTQTYVDVIVIAY